MRSDIAKKRAVWRKQSSEQFSEYRQLSMMEKELVPEDQRANFIETLDAVMLDYESAV